MKKKSGRAKRLKLLNEVVRLKQTNDRLEEHLKIQTAKLKELTSQVEEQKATFDATNEALDSL